MKIEIFISTLNNKLNNIHENTKKNNNLTIINQVPNKLDGSINERMVDNIRWIDYDQRGLSKSRNLALELSNADYVYLTDDDVIIYPDFDNIIEKAIRNNIEYDIFAFNINRIDSNQKFGSSEKEIGYLKSLNLSSVYLIFKKSFLTNNNIKFDDRFGVGAEYHMGEENIILFDSLKAGAKIKYIPDTIGELIPGESSWFVGINEKYLYDRGATYQRMFGLLSPIVSFLFVIKKKSILEESIGIKNAFKFMLNGIKDFSRKDN